MVQEFLDYLLMKREKQKLNQILVKPFVVFHIIMTVIVVSLGATLIFTKNETIAIFMFISTLILFVVFYLVGDKKIKSNSKIFEVKLKEDVRQWLRKKGFNHSSQYKEFASMLKEYRIKKEINLSLDLSLTIPIWSSLVAMGLREDFTTNNLFLTYALVITVMISAFVFLVKSIRLALINYKNDRIDRYLEIIRENAIDESIRENK